MNWNSFRNSSFRRRWVSWAAIAVIAVYLVVMMLFRSPQFDGYEWGKVVDILASNSGSSNSPNLFVETETGRFVRVRNNNSIIPVPGDPICLARQKWNFWGTLILSHADNQECEN